MSSPDLSFGGPRLAARPLFRAPAEALPALRLGAAPFRWLESDGHPLSPAPALPFCASTDPQARSQLGGLPLAGPDFIWPSAEDLVSGRRRHPRLLAQIALEGLPEARGLLPGSGSLVFFEPHTGYRRGSIEGALVQHVADGPGLKRHACPSGFRPPLPATPLEHGGPGAPLAQLLGEAGPEAEAFEEGYLLLALPGWRIRIPPEDLAEARFERAFLTAQ